MVWSRSLPKSNPVGRTHAEQAAGAARFATGCPPAPGQKKHNAPMENRVLFAPAKIRPTWIRHAANLRVCLVCREAVIPATNRTQRFSSAAVPPPKDPHLDSRYSGPWFPQPRALFFFTRNTSLQLVFAWPASAGWHKPGPPALALFGCRTAGSPVTASAQGILSAYASGFLSIDYGRLRAPRVPGAGVFDQRSHGWRSAGKSE
jgi:hypothetical protein